VARCRFQTDKELISLKEKRTALSIFGWLYMLLKNNIAMRGAKSRKVRTAPVADERGSMHVTQMEVLCV
jgi:hypothetical protein